VSTGITGDYWTWDVPITIQKDIPEHIFCQLIGLLVLTSSTHAFIL